MIDAMWAWVAIGALGLLHGANPAMGWLFAVALGLQEGRERAVWRALGPLAAGHAMAVGAAVLVASAAGVMLGGSTLRWVIGSTLVVVGARKLFRSGHPGFGGMQVGVRDLTLWSALMATAHGAGLMVLPFLPRVASAAVPGGHGHGVHAAHGPLGLGEAHLVGTPGASAHVDEGLADGGNPLLAGAGDPFLTAAGESGTLPDLVGSLVVTVVHTGTYLLASGLLAWLVYRRFGVGILRTHWINLDRIWALALIVTGAATPWI